MMHEARYYKTLTKDKAQCLLCPHKCRLNNGQWGICQVRQANDGKIFDMAYGHISSLALDPVEKKPLYHFHPGAQILSVGSLGCNFNCSFCQNFNISQIGASDLKNTDVFSPASIVDIAANKNPSAGIAFTYNEPMINFDFIYDTARLAKKRHIPTAVVSNGYINAAPLAELIPYIDAFNIDLKGFTNNFYRQYTGGKLQPVLDVLQQITTSQKHLEITHLLITEANDNENEFSSMINWIAEKLGKNTPLHISRYFPQHRFSNPATNTELINTYVQMAKEKLSFVYPGNVDADASTYCPQCKTKVISRTGFRSQNIALSGQKCINCNYELPIII